MFLPPYISSGNKTFAWMFKKIEIKTGIYIMQNTMVRGEGGKWPLGKKIKNQELGKTNEKEKEQKGGKLHKKKKKKYFA